MSKPYITNLKEKSIWKCNCVIWARSKVEKLPHGLWIIGDKKKIINDQIPQIGSVAILNVGMPWGHCAVVHRIGKNHITIREANYRTCRLTERHDSPLNLKIVGYFNPNK